MLGAKRHGCRLNYVERKGGIVWAVPPMKATDDDINRVLAALTAELKRGSPYVLLFDLTLSAMPNATQRQKLASHIRDNEVRIQRWVRGVGVVLSSPLARGIVTAVFWVAPPKVPYRLFTSRSEASDWADSLVEAAR
jgi:hypothetical protein